MLQIQFIKSEYRAAVNTYWALRIRKVTMHDDAAG